MEAHVRTFKEIRRGHGHDREAHAAGGRTAVAERPAATAEGGRRRDRTEPSRRAATRRRAAATDRAAATAGTVGNREHMHTARARQREQFGGMNWGAAFFGWLVAIGLGALLVGLLAAAGVAVGLTEPLTATRSAPRRRSASAARSRCWPCLWSPTAAAATSRAGCRASTAPARVSPRGDRRRRHVALAVAAAVFGSEYNVLERLNLPALPVGDGELATGGAIALAAVVIVTLVAAVAGGKAGERYHRRVDRRASPTNSWRPRRRLQSGTVG